MLSFAKSIRAGKTFASSIILIFLLSGCAGIPKLRTPELETGLSESAFKEKRAVIFENSREGLDLIWPVRDGLVTQEFKQKRGRKRAHRGIDIAAPKGDDVYASHDGLVIFAGRQFRGFGKLVIIENDRGDWATFYSHLSKITTKQGRRVRQGELIGHIGRTGRATGYHLHFEVRYNKEPLNPLTVLP